MGLAKVIRLAGRVPVFSKLLRWGANLYREGSIVTIPSGHARGMRWSRSHRFVNGYWLGQYEIEVQNAIVNELQPGDGFFDIGANAGFFTLIGCKAVGPAGWCVAFEPDADNCRSMGSQIELNGLKNCTILQQAVADQAGSMEFVRPIGGATVGHLSPREGEAGEREAGERVSVEVVTIDSACEKYGIPRLVKMDIEGAEFLALQGATRAIEEIRPAWLIELHGADVSEQVRRRLSDARYDFFAISGRQILAGANLPPHVMARPASMAKK